MKIVDLHIQRGIAKHGPPLEIKVNGGRVLEMTLGQEVCRSYTGEEILLLLQAAGVEVENLLIPIPSGIPLNATVTPVPGEYLVDHRRKSISLPEEAFIYHIKNLSGNLLLFQRGK